MPNDSAAELLEVAREAARAASELLANARPSAIRTKSNPRDLVTEWDLRAEDTIRTVLRNRTPFPILGEEGGEVAGQGAAGMRWIVDPIDGTVNFAHGLPIWSIAIALEQAPGDTIAGVVAAPALGWWFEGARGAGATANGERMTVSAVPVVAQALLVSGFPYDTATNPVDNFAEWEHLGRRAGGIRRLGCASLDLCLVARGWMDGYWERHLKAWDIAAGALFVVEAGGTVTNTRGGPFDSHEGEVAASNGAIHEELITELGVASAIREARRASQDPA